MNVDTALHVAHQATRRGCIGDNCRNSDCVSCATVVMASEIRRLRAVVAQMGRLLEAKPVERKPPAVGPCICGRQLIDGICAECDA